MISKNLTIDLWKKLKEPLAIVQHEASGRKLAIQLASGGAAVDLTGCSVNFYATKPSGSIVYNACTVTDAAGGLIEWTITEQTCNESGALSCLLTIDKTGESMRSQTFDITVSESPDVSGAAESTNEFTALSDALSTVSGHEARIAAAESNIDDLEEEVQPINRGGTGQTTVALARNAFGLGNTDGPLPIANGGTGASTAAAALANLGISTPVTDTFEVALYGGTTPGSPTYSNRMGRWVKLGPQVWITFYVNMSDAGGLDGSLNIGNLPFTIAHADMRPILTVLGITVADATFAYTQLNNGTKTATIGVQRVSSGAFSTTGVTHSHLNLPTRIYGEFTYYTTDSDPS